MNANKAYKAYLNQCKEGCNTPIHKSVFTKVFYLVVDSQSSSLRQAAKPLVKYLRNNKNPHSIILVDETKAECLSGEQIEHYKL